MFEIPEVTESRWIKDIKTRMRVFNGQIFDAVYKKYGKDNKEWHLAYLEKNFNHLLSKILKDRSIGYKEFDNFCEQYDANLDKLADKENNDKKAFPKKT